MSSRSRGYSINQSIKFIDSTWYLRTTSPNQRYVLLVILGRLSDHDLHMLLTRLRQPLALLFRLKSNNTKIFLSDQCEANQMMWNAGEILIRSVEKILKTKATIIIIFLKILLFPENHFSLFWLICRFLNYYCNPYNIYAGWYTIRIVILRF